MSKFLITGAAGFIGSQLAYKLYKDGEEVILIDNFSYGKEDNLIFADKDFRNEILTMDIRNREDIYGLFEKEKFDYVYHVAGITPLPDCQLNPGEAVEVNVAGTVNILEAGRMYGVKKIVFASTSAVYENNTSFPLVEDEVVPPSLIYPNTKYTAEYFCQAYVKAYGMNITCLRFANVYGPHIDCLRKQPPVLGYLIKQFYLDKPPVLHSTGEQQRDFVYVEDLIDLAIRVKDGEGFDAVNVSTNETHSINEMAEITRRLMGKDDIGIEYTASENYWKHYPGLYEGAYKISTEMLDHEVKKYTLLSYDHAKEKYGWEPKVSFEEGIRRTIEFSVKELVKSGI